MRVSCWARGPGKKLLDNFYERQVHVRSYFELRVVAGPKCARKLKTKLTRSCAEPGGSLRNYYAAPADSVERMGVATRPLGWTSDTYASACSAHRVAVIHSTG